MPKRKLIEEFDAIIQTVKQYPEGIPLDKLFQELTPRLPRRTLQRRLAHLVEIKRLNAKGRHRGVRYYPAISAYHYSPITPTQNQLRVEEALYIPISEAAEKIKWTIRQPIQKRRLVGYNREFLSSYEPNSTYYLSESLRTHLREIAAPPDGHQTAGTFARTIMRRLLIDLSCNSSRLEGNTYSLLETKHLFELGNAAQGKTPFETQMILNHKTAIDFLVNSANQIEFNSYTILNLHAMLAENLLNSQACGQLRTIAVGIGKTVYHPLAMPQQIDEYFQCILAKANTIQDPFEQAFFVMVQLPYLQPFEDVNKRVSRLAANIPFIKQNLSPLSFIDVPEQDYIDGMLGVYELNKIELLRDVFVWAYERSAARYSVIKHSLGQPDPFRLYYREQIKEVVATVVKKRLDQHVATLFIQQWAAEHLRQPDRSRFVEVVETELLALHEGNIARYYLSPAEFRAWHLTWSVK